MRRWLWSLRPRGLAIGNASEPLAAASGKRVLINEILSLQILITAVIGALAIAGLYWGGQWVLQKNYSRWALQWTEELNELGAPLYLPSDEYVERRLETYIARYPEIDRVTYFRLDGSAIASLANEGEVPAGMDYSLSSSQLARVSSLVGNVKPYLLESRITDVRTFDIFAPIWTESIANDGLFDFDPLSDETKSSVELVGFVGLQLDFTEFHDNLVGNIKLATVALLLLLVVSGFLGRLSLRRALSAISDLQHPIAELAKGNLAVRFKPAAHREISEIVEALETTAKELGERDAKLLQLANHDPLTGLYNRRRFVEELEQMIADASRSRNRGALLFIDLDQFKYVNDTCGHPAGDRLIIKVAEQLQRSVGSQGIVARFGGDEFAVLAWEVNRRDATALAERILEQMRQLVHVEDNNAFHVHCSIGVTMIRGGIGSHDDLIARADIACREAKSRGRNRLEFYKVSKREAEQMAADVGWMRRLREAIDTDAFVVRYQPIAEVASGNISHHEVLLRMHGENGQLIGPDVFLPAAVRFGLMAEIDAWMIRNVIAKMKGLRIEYGDLRLSINLSPNAFETENLARYVQTQLTEHGVAAEAVVFEITENLAVRHLQHVENQITALRELGCEVALDDFGKGYSSLGHLQQLSVDYIKIDGSFIRNLSRNPVDQKMVRLIGEIGNEAGMRTVAEYVQNAKAFSMLGDLGIEYAQGYYIGKPLAAPCMKPVPVALSSKRHAQRQAIKS